MKRILLLGAGRSSSSLIKYILDHARACEWHLTVGDLSVQSALKMIGSSQAAADALSFDVRDIEASREIIRRADIVISLLPPAFHAEVALLCLRAGKHFITASYVSDELKALDAEARAKGLIFLNECGLDPGIDHLSAMRVIDAIRNNGGNIFSFESFTGGLIAPETDRENPWRYKFTWNPRNVVTAGQGTAKYLSEGKQKYIAYAQLFSRITPVHLPGHGSYEGYPNRDSLKYIDIYGLKDVRTMLRGTLRHPGFCDAWNIFVQLGCCDDTYSMGNISGMTHADFLDSFLPTIAAASTIEEKLCLHFGMRPDTPQIAMLRWSGFFDDVPVGISEGSPARILECILNKKWALQDDDKDLIVMWHRFGYELNGTQKETQASLVAIGSDARDTAMAKTVGLPLGMAAKLIALEKIRGRGVLIPATREFYEPMLEELATFGIALNEWQTA